MGWKPFELLIMVAFSLRLSLAGEIGYCSNGYAASSSALITNFPEGTVPNQARSQLECSALCVQKRDCLQTYFNITAGLCYLTSSSVALRKNAASSKPGRLLTVPSPMYSSGRSCSSVTCPADTVCVTDCSSAFCGPMCVANNAKCESATEIINVKHYFTARYEDASDQGVVQTAAFNKTRADTAIRVQWYATTRTHCQASRVCGRHFITFNGVECSNPTTIDFSNYDASLNDHHRLSELDGICYGLPAGIVTVSINVGACPGYVLSDSWTGWNAVRTMWVSEILSVPAPASCSILPVFNVQQLALRFLDNGADPDTAIMSMVYTKVASDTALRIKWIATARTLVPQDVGYCTRWYATVNGLECNPRVEFVVGMFGLSLWYAQDNHKTRTMEGFCYNLAAATYTITVRVGSCYYASVQPDSYSGCCSSVSRFIVDEVRIASKVQAVTTASGKILKLPFFNLQHYYWYLLNNDANEGNILNVVYNKWSDTSGLHLHMVGDARVYATGGCCRWYFTIDGAECSNPGFIEGVSYTDNNVNYHNPGVIDGVCYGYSSGAHTIGYNVGRCNGYGVYDCATGWGSTVNIVVEEVQPDQRVTCNNPLLC